MEWYVKLSLAALGLIELALRLVIVIILCISVMGIMLYVLESEESIGDLLTPWCFTYISETERQQKSQQGTVSLSLRQRRRLETMRQENQIIAERRDMLADINRLESHIGEALR